ncbi:hypothetical protein WMY93_007374 [Mugilogobius chulae]|uniref:Uncharacterized protein n=1 Tax=Mugilogobius chulae TaxID=88201 RepID=A0AAW0PRG3_9GOBI
MHGMELGVIPVPRHTVMLDSEFVQGPVIVGVRPALPLPGVSLILGNDLVGVQVQSAAHGYFLQDGLLMRKWVPCYGDVVGISPAGQRPARDLHRCRMADPGSPHSSDNVVFQKNALRGCKKIDASWASTSLRCAKDRFGKQLPLCVAVDATVIHLMDDASLAVYVPAYGDRLAVRRFCLEDKDGPSTSNSKKNSLLESLKQKMGIQGNQDNDVMEGHASKKKRAHGINNKWARKKTRKIEIGWIHEGKQVRKRRGGGTRTIDVPKETRKADLFTYAKDLFFPEGKNKIGDFESVTADIVDYQEEPIIDNNVTVGELYDTLKMGMLRFYLSTRINCDNDEVKESAGEDQEDDWNMIIQTQRHLMKTKETRLKTQM